MQAKPLFRRAPRLTKRRTRASLVLIGVFACAVAHPAAQDEQGSAEPAGEAEIQSASDRDAPAATSSGSDNTESSEVFLPTEEVSEDYAVPFPVDI